ncbi:MAG: 2-amino-4-hydroxy-6-hydroxymethyldihydropteridine diphosphokinase [Candidatus Cloacimonetes bacterium]|nr:2-amino-4-hydroxy-6-hydroxymethyldihydropteridine diphosphokinase [Candidatus Cloacimonadota bacterium]
MTAWLSLGSNLQDPGFQVQNALRHLEAYPGIRVLRKSSLMRSKAYGKEDQPDFFNQMVEIDTEYEPNELLERMLELEAKLGRVREERWGPRVIDIDILLYGSLEIQSPSLTLPHPDFHRRCFVLELLSEVEPELWHPVLNKTVSQLLDELNCLKEAQ